MRKAITLTLSVALLGVFAAVVVAAVGPADDGTSTVPTTTTTDTVGTTTAEDSLPRAAGVDIPGPCDEAEHANDPRCTGAGVPDEGGRLDNSGPGSANSGPGSVSSDDFDDQGGDDFADDSSGSGHGGGGKPG